MRAEPSLLSLEDASWIAVCDVKLEKEQNTNADGRFCGTNAFSSKPGPGSPANIGPSNSFAITTDFF